MVPFIKLNKYIQWNIYLKFNNDIFLVIGAGATKFEGWFSTDIDTLDVTNTKDFEKYFNKKRIKKVLAEHVLEHLSVEDINKMIKNIYNYSSAELTIRIAVPDGFHTDKEYIDAVKPGGTGYGSDDHKHLFTYKSLSKIFEDSGFKSNLIEYWDENGKFHSNYDEKNGYIQRSLAHDKRNKDGNPHYTSLIIDFTKNISK
ncbi:MAG: hypothetical protein WCE54_01885 [Ignavibacteriaceae bacterium]